MNIIIKNCNCINEANISIIRKKINIKFAPNGTGKTSIAYALHYHDKPDILKEFIPYGDNSIPEIIGMKYKKVRVFDESYINNYLFSDNSVLNSTTKSYQVFVKNDTLEEQKKIIQKKLSKLVEELRTTQELTKLNSFLESSGYKILENKFLGGLNEILKGFGEGFENYHILDSYKVLYQDKSLLAKWANWRIDGIKFNNKNICPYCTKRINQKSISEENECIKNVFKKSALEKANEIISFLSNGVSNGFINHNASLTLQKYFGVNSETEELKNLLIGLSNECKYIQDKIKVIYQYFNFEIDLTNLSSSKDSLALLKFDEHCTNVFFNTKKIKHLYTKCNREIDKLLDDLMTFEKNYKQLNGQIKARISNNKKEINKILNAAGFNYYIDLKNQKNTATLLQLRPLKFISDDTKNIDKIQKHLSYGEKIAFALTMFLFEVNSDKADLIILDDPISSFDENKKYSFLRQLFNEEKNSFTNKTVLLLTHDVQPIIDLIKLDSFGMQKKINASYLVKDLGVIHEQSIQSKDLTNIVITTEMLAKNINIHPIIRVVNLRKHIEFMGIRKNNKTWYAYNILSRLIHNKDTICYKNGKSLTTYQIKVGTNFIKKYIKDFTYEDILRAFSEKELLSIVKDIKSSNHYLKTLAFRLWCEQHRDDHDDYLNDLRGRFPDLCKFINSTNHIENDYVFQLDPNKFFQISDTYYQEILKFLRQKKR